MPLSIFSPWSTTWRTVSLGITLVMQLRYPRSLRYQRSVTWSRLLPWRTFLPETELIPGRFETDTPGKIHGGVYSDFSSEERKHNRISVAIGNQISSPHDPGIAQEQVIVEINTCIYYAFVKTRSYGLKDLVKNQEGRGYPKKKNLELVRLVTKRWSAETSCPVSKWGSESSRPSCLWKRSTDPVELWKSRFGESPFWNKV